MTNFYAAPAVIARGEETLLCYGTEAADDVKIDPPVESLKPSLSRCFNVKPDKTTEYKLSVSRGGESTSKTATVTVQVPKPAGQARLIRFFVADRQEAAAGEKVTLCYGTVGGAKVNLSPGDRVLQASERTCISFPVAETTTYKLSAVLGDGSKDAMQLVIRVK